MNTLLEHISMRSLYALVGFLMGILVTVSFTHIPTYQGTVLASVDAKVKHHDVIPRANKPIQALDKKELNEEGMVSREVLKDDTREVLATGISKDSAGTKEISAVLDLSTGLSHIEQKTPFAEWMKTGSLSAGYAVGSLGNGEVLNLAFTPFRIGKVYGDVNLTGYHWETGDRINQNHKYDGQVSALLRFNF